LVVLKKVASLRQPSRLSIDAENACGGLQLVDSVIDLVADGRTVVRKNAYATRGKERGIHAKADQFWYCRFVAIEMQLTK